MKPLVILSGPTAVGKTSTSIKLAKIINGEIISADSMQVYKGMDIGTAKIRENEMCGVPHHLIDIMEPDEEFNICIFKKKATQAIEEIYSRNHVPIIVGGTGFYIQSVLYDTEFDEEENDYSYRNELTELAASKGNEYVHNMLKEVDEESAKAIHMNNVKRVIRALEYYHLTGKKISEHNEKQRKNESPYNYLFYVLTDDRDALYQRIDARVDLMVSEGLFKEVDNLIKKGYNGSLVSMQGIGYKEVLSYYNNNISKEGAIDAIKLNTRHFAKRQLTWFKRDKSVKMINIKDYNYDTTAVATMMANEIKADILV